ncbi:MAG TPA: peptidoglycan-binding domain-containing protein, partial [Actinomycetes bacterium]
MTTGTISPWPLVRQGDKEHPVQSLQYLLRARGHSVVVDGIFGPATDAAVRAFQRQRGL